MQTAVFWDVAPYSPADNLCFLLGSYRLFDREEGGSVLRRRVGELQPDDVALRRVVRTMLQHCYTESVAADTAVPRQVLPLKYLHQVGY
jgi:hypothetical protein